MLLDLICFIICRNMHIGYLKSFWFASFLTKNFAILCYLEAGYVYITCCLYFIKAKINVNIHGLVEWYWLSSGQWLVKWLIGSQIIFDYLSDDGKESGTILHQEWGLFSKLYTVQYAFEVKSNWFYHFLL